MAITREERAPFVAVGGNGKSVQQKKGGKCSEEKAVQARTERWQMAKQARTERCQMAKQARTERWQMAKQARTERWQMAKQASVANNDGKCSEDWAGQYSTESAVKIGQASTVQNRKMAGAAAKKAAKKGQSRTEQKDCRQVLQRRRQRSKGRPV